MAITQGFAGSGGGGGGGAVTLAGGSVSSGAYVLGSVLDGAIVTLGTLGDGAVGDASGSLNAHTRQIAKLLGAGITLGAGAAVIGAVTQSGSWTVTANAGTGTFAVSAASLPLPSGASTETTLALIKAKTDNLDVALSTRTKPADKQIAVGFGDVLIATLTRPNNTTAYAVGDEMTDTGGAILQFSGAALANGGGGAVTGLVISNSQNAATKATGELRLYHTTSTPATDNAPFDASDGVNDTCVAVIPFNTASDGLAGTGGNCSYPIGELFRRYKCAGGDTKLYGRVILKTAYTSPNGSDTWQFALRVEIDS